MDPRTEFRDARSTDAAVIAQLHTRNFRENNRGLFGASFLQRDLPAEILGLWRHRLDGSAEDQYLQVVFEETSLLGFVCAFGSYDARWGSLVDNLHVVSSARKTGIGAGLMKRVHSWLMSRHGEVPVHLYVLETNTVARRLYEQLGADNVETLEMASHVGTMVSNCRYVWSGPQEICDDRYEEK